MNRFLIIICVLLGSFSLSFAAPLVTGVTGTVLHDGSITISGSNFGTKSPAAPLKWDDFEDGVDGNSLPNEASGGWQTPTNYVHYSTTQTRGVNDTMAVEQDFTRSTGSYGAGLELETTVSGETKLYFSGWWYMNTISATNNFKMYNLAQEYGSGNWSTRIDIHPSTNSGTMNINGNCPADDNTVNYANASLMEGDDGSWHRLDGWIDIGTPNNSDGYRDAYVDNVLWEKIENKQVLDGDCSGGIGYAYVGHYYRISEVDGGGEAKRYWSELYFDITKARVEISANQSWVAGTHREIQIPSAWSSSSITVTVNQGSFSDSSTAYLFVIDSDGNMNTTGYEITFGGGGDITAPEVFGNSVIGSDGSTVTINFSEIVVTTGYDNGDFDIDCTNAGDGVSLNSISGTGSARTFILEKVIYINDSCTLNYTGGADEIEDVGGNDLAQFSGDAMTNDSTMASVAGVSINQ